MSQWGYALLAVFVALGVSPIGIEKAIRIAALLTVGGIAYAFYAYGVL